MDAAAAQAAASGTGRELHYTRSTWRRYRRSLLALSDDRGVEDRDTLLGGSPQDTVPLRLTEGRALNAQRQHTPDTGGGATPTVNSGAGTSPEHDGSASGVSLWLGSKNAVQHYWPQCT